MKLLLTFWFGNSFGYISKNWAIFSNFWSLYSGAYPRVEHLKRCFTWKHWTRLENLARRSYRKNKHIFGILRTFLMYVCSTKFENDQILLNKISHRFLVTTKLLSGWKSLTSLLRTLTNYSHKKFYSIGPWLKCLFIILCFLHRFHCCK